jgi:hypothetical protein
MVCSFVYVRSARPKRRAVRLRLLFQNAVENAIGDMTLSDHGCTPRDASESIGAEGLQAVRIYVEPRTRPVN